MIEIIEDSEIYCRVIQEEIPRAETFVWIATSDLKDLYVKKNSRMVPFLEILSDLIEKGVSIRLIHAKEPGPAFRKDFDRYPNLFEGMERLLCPRVHFKCVLVDARMVYMGSANLTGAGMGAKSDSRRNFEMGILSTDEEVISHVMTRFDRIWMGEACSTCRRKEFCGDYHDLCVR